MSIVAMYGLPIRDMIASGDLDAMKAFAFVSEQLLSQADDLESEDLADWKAAHEELLLAIEENDVVEISREDVIATKNGISVIDNSKLARALKDGVASDLEFEFKIHVVLKK